MPRKDRKRAKLTPGICVFCNIKDDDELKYGKIYHHNGITTHYYCLLLSSNMQQKGSDDEGILGFLKFDILNELRRGKRLACTYCKRNGATLNCCNTKCKKAFHLPCGLKSGSLHQFFGEFRSYCLSHRPKQQIDERIKAQVPDQLLCYICYDNVERNNLLQTLWAPCCKKNAWFHRDCVQQLAMSAGYFFKCPLCNNKKEFQKAMLDNGIFIPCQDASWELVPNAFQELLYRHNRCDAPRCKCSKGRRYTSSNPKWELMLCRTCGSQGVHVACGKLKWLNASWDCSECTSILNKTIGNDSTNQSINSTSNDNYEASDCESDSDISVGIETPVYGPSPWPAVAVADASNVRIRPGPKSFKLKQQKILNEICDSNSGGSSGPSSPRSDPSSFGESSRGSLITDGDGFINEKQFSCFNDDSNAAMSGEKAESHQGSGQGDSSGGNILYSLLRTESEGQQDDVVTIESDEEPIQEADEPPRIIENVLKTNDGLRIPVHSAPHSLPHDLRIVGDVRLPMPKGNSSTSASTSSSDATSLQNGTSMGHIIVGPSDDPMIIGNFQMPAAQIMAKPVSHPVENTSIPLRIPQLSSMSHITQPPDDSIMQIKITNVTSLPPEVFANEPEPTSQQDSLITQPQDLVDIESENEEIAYHLSMASQLRQSIVERNQGIRDDSARQSSGPDQVPQSNSAITKPIDDDSRRNEEHDDFGVGESSSVPTSLRTYRPKKKNSPQKLPYKAAASPVVKQVSGIVQSVQTQIRVYNGKRGTDKRPSPEPVIRLAPVPRAPPVMGQPLKQQMETPKRIHGPRKRQKLDPQNQVDPLPDAGVCLDNAAIVSVMGKEFVIPLAKLPAVKVNGTWKPEYDGDAGKLSAEDQTRVTGDNRGHRNSESMEIRQCQCKSKFTCFHQRESDYSTSSSTDDTSSCESSDYRDRLKENEVYLKDLKFKVSNHEILKMTVRDGLTVDLNIDTVRKRRPGPKCKTLRKRFNFGPSWIQRFLVSSKSKDEPETNHVGLIKESSIGGTASKFPETGESDAVKENVAPLTAIKNASFPSVPERKNKRLSTSSDCPRRYYSSPQKNPEFPGPSRDGLKDLSHSFVNQRHESISVQSAESKKLSEHRRASLPEISGNKLHVSIELSRIQPLLMKKPDLFAGHNGQMRNLMKSKSFNDLENYSVVKKYGAGTLRRSKSLDDLASSCILNNFDININNCIFNLHRKGQKRKRSFEKHDCVR